MALLDRLKRIWSSEYNEGRYLPQKQNTEKKEGQTLQEKQTNAASLTPREHDLFLLLLEGYTLKECAKQLSVKYSTANTHMTGIYKKLGVNSRAELIIHYRDIKDTVP
ncbi:helix-turn-helix transcriptional regulator [Papillibacter cinnamivorans]|uniref:Regulatory protein, luxR family n=1 Tax=Papillibacter cinnamivorans DSM 12816 TaxID=1122930 RepID=A0A1W2B9W3_9FIRM|nr:helix-turn-helix transcriptional regulator [Papillibacter cinnamivorans]SMC69709.1 regulatory protein, luxR family [Papillibacter cinnamivorans DSM 12816]